MEAELLEVMRNIDETLLTNLVANWISVGLLIWISIGMVYIFNEI